MAWIDDVAKLFAGDVYLGDLTDEYVTRNPEANRSAIGKVRRRAAELPADDLERLVRCWYAMSILTGRYAGSPETAFDVDIRQIESQGLAAYVEAVIANELPDTFWTGMLPQLMDTSSSTTPTSSRTRRPRRGSATRAFSPPTSPCGTCY